MKATSSTQTVTLTGLTPNGSYQLYLYGQNGNYKSRGATFSITTGIGAPAVGSNAATANVSNSSFVENVNYVVFNVYATAAGTLGISWTQPPAGGGEGDFNGLQLVPAGISSATAATGIEGVPFSYTITASDSPTSFNATGLPAGLSVNTTTGVISGTPTTVGNSSVALSATNANGTSTATLSLSVAATADAVDTIDVNFSGGSDTITGVGAYIGDGQASPKWNNVRGATSILFTSNNVAADGVGLSFTDSGTNSATTTPSLLSQMLQALSSSTQTVTLTGLTPNGSYQLYLYGQNGYYKSRGATFSITTGSGAPAAGSNAATANVSNSSFVKNVNYVIFNVNANSAGTLGISWTQPLAGGGEGDFNGFQLVPTSGAPALSSATTAAGTAGVPFTYTITASNSPTSFGATGLPPA